MKYLILCVFLSLSLYAETCPESVRLKDYAVQDQDGLGTCYANVGALMLQHKLNLNKYPSYLQMSLSASIDKAESSFISENNKKKKQLFIEGGEICKTLNKAAYDGWCDADLFGVESWGISDKYLAQDKFFKGIGELLDSKQDTLKNLVILNRNGKQQEFESKLAKLLFERDQICSKEPHDYLAERIAKRLETRWKKRISELKNGDATNMKKLYDSAFQNGAPKKEFLSYIKSDFLREIEYQMELDYYGIKKLDFSNENVLLLWWGFEKKISRNNLFNEKWSKDNSELINDFKNYSLCYSEKGRLSVLEKFLQDPFCNEKLTTIDPKFLEESKDILKSLLESTSSNSKSKLSSFLGVVSPACNKQMKDRFFSKGEKSILYPLCLIQKVNSVEEIAAKATELLCSGQPVGVSICSSFLKSDEPFFSEFCNPEKLKDAPEVAKHGNHAVTLTGYKKHPNGKKMFLIQNSWGRGCPFDREGKVPEKLQKFVECEYTKEGEATGRFWVLEDLLFNNSLDISFFDN